MTTETDRLKQAERAGLPEWDLDFDRSTEEIKAEEQSQTYPADLQKRVRRFNLLAGFTLLLLFIGLFAGTGFMIGGYWWLAFFFIWPLFGSCNDNQQRHGHIPN